MAFQLDRQFQYDPYDRLSLNAWAPRGLVVGSEVSGATTEDGVLQGSNGSTFVLRARDGGVSTLYREMWLDAAALVSYASGFAKFAYANNSIYSFNDQEVSLGRTDRRWNTVRSNTGYFHTDIIIGGSHTTLGAVSRGYISGHTASDATAARTGYLEFHGQNTTRYGYLGNGVGIIWLALENSAFFDISSGAATTVPTIRITRGDNSNNHIELVAGNTNGAKQHLGSYLGLLYITSGSYFNGTSWVQDSSGTAAARMDINVANASGTISFKATNTNNTPDPPERFRIQGDGYTRASNFLILESAMTYSMGGSGATAALIVHGTTTKSGTLTIISDSTTGVVPQGTFSIPAGQFADIPWFHAGMHCITVLHPGITYNQAWVTCIWDGSNGGIAVMAEANATNNGSRISASNLGFGLQVANVSGGTGLRIINRNAAVVVEVTVNTFIAGRA